MNKLNARYALGTDEDSRTKRYKQLRDTLAEFQSAFNVGYIDDFKVTNDGEGNISSNFYLVTEIVVGAKTNQGKIGILTSRQYECKGGCYYGGNLGGVIMVKGNKFDTCVSRAGLVGVDNFDTTNLVGKEKKKYDVANPFEKMKTGSATQRQYGGLGVYFGWAAATVSVPLKFAYTSATNFMIYCTPKIFTVAYATFLSSFKKAKVFSPTGTRL